MSLLERQKDSRRDALAVEFPLTDGQGLIVEKDRRRVPDRRTSEYLLSHPISRLPITGSRSKSRLIFISLIITLNVAFALMVYALIVAIQS